MKFFVAKKAYYLQKLKEEEDLDEQSNFLIMILQLKSKMNPMRHLVYPQHDFFYDSLRTHQELKIMKASHPDIKKAALLTCALYENRKAIPAKELGKEMNEIFGEMLTALKKFKEDW